MKKMNHLLGFMVLGLALSVTSCGKSYTVTFDTNDGSTILAVTVDGKGTVGTVANPTKEGHNFAGWYLDEAFTQEVDLTTYVPTADVTVYAKWTVESFDINFEENGGTAVSDTTAEYGKPVTLPAAPTKEGYDFVKWYLDEELMQPYANQAIKEDTTLYAKWRSSLVYVGTETNEAIYNPEDGTYSFTIELGLWGRFQLMYQGNYISADDENLTITGLFTDGAADWTKNLYCGGEEGGPVDYTTFICSHSSKVLYGVTYDPANNVLDIQDVTPAIEVPETGFYYNHTYTNSTNGVDLSELTKVELNPDTNTYSFEVELAAWRYVNMYYNGQPVDSVDIVKNFNVNGGNIYIGDGTDPTTNFYTSVANKYKFEYTPATADSQAVVTTSLVIEIPETGVYYMYTNPANVLQAPKAATYDEATGSYSFEVELAQWRYAQIYVDGVAVDSADENLEYTLASGLYIDTDDATKSNRFYTNSGDTTKYEFTYTPATETTKAKLETALVIPSTGVCFAYTNPSNSVVLLYGNKVVEENGVYTVSVDLAQWRYVKVYENGEAIPASAMTVTGDGWVDGTYDNSTNGSLYIDSDPANFLRSQAGTVNYKVSYNPETNALVIDNLALDESEEPSNSVKVDILSTKGENDSELIVWDTANDAIYSNKTYNLANGWRLYIVVDAEGKIAYMGDMPAKGYVVEEPRNFVCHSDYADLSTNPVVVADDEWSIKVPEGGFIISAYPGSDGSLTARDLYKAITGVDYVESEVHTKTASFDVDNVRVSHVDGVVTIIK